MHLVRKAKGIWSTLIRNYKKWSTIAGANLVGNRTAVPLALLESIQNGSLAYRYRGLPLEKNPFDLALYAMLIGSVRPSTIVEIGSRYGGSAVWFADQALLNGIEAEVFSFDVRQENQSAQPNIHFLEADIYDLSNSELPKIMARAKRPILISEDGPHTFRGSLSALRFFDSFLTPGDYIVIEDGNLANLGYWGFGGGPTKAIQEFLTETTNEYLIDRDYSDFFGKNVTWNINGWLRRLN